LQFFSGTIPGTATQLNTKIHKENNHIKYVKDKTEMNKRQIWDLLEIYRLLQNATSVSDQHEGFELLHNFIEENCLKEESEE
jgi:hypothetical protein